MGTPKLSLEKYRKNGKPAIRLVVRNAHADATLEHLLDTLGVLPVCDESNCQAIVCSTPAELDAVREPIKHLFDNAGNWVGAL